jgi:hypothetical protein
VSAPFNPYAPPAAELERRGQVGEVVRKGKLIGMRPDGQLPPRCVACNAQAEGDRSTRVLYWSPLAWRVSVLAAIVALLGLSAAGVVAAAIAFWPAMLMAAVANFIIRKKVSLELAVCERHRRIQAALTWAAALGIALVVAGIYYLMRIDPSALLVAVTAMFAVGIARSRTGALAVRIARLERDRLWLKGTGKAFRESLPEAADA